MNKFFDINHAIYKPLWVRILLTGVCAAWAMFEFYIGAPFWGILFLVLTGWCAWQFFVSFGRG